MRKTTVLIDEDLLRAVMKAARARTKREAIEARLRKLVRSRGRQKLGQELGTFL